VEIVHHFQEHGRKATLKAYGKQDASKIVASSELNIYLPKKGDIMDMDWELYDHVHGQLEQHTGDTSHSLTIPWNAPLQTSSGSS
jgi:hypothetical protein